MNLDCGNLRKFYAPSPLCGSWAPATTDCRLGATKQSILYMVKGIFYVKIVDTYSLLFLCSQPSFWYNYRVKSHTSIWTSPPVLLVMCCHQVIRLTGMSVSVTVVSTSSTAYQRREDWYCRYTILVTMVLPHTNPLKEALYWNTMMQVFWEFYWHKLVDYSH